MGEGTSTEILSAQAKNLGPWSTVAIGEVIGGLRFFAWALRISPR